MENAILIIVLAAIFGGAIAYIVRAKKRGVKCIGCSACGQKGGSCSRCDGGCGCENTGADERNSCGCREEKK